MAPTATWLQAILQRRKLRRLGNVKFIGELFKLKLLTEKIVHECIRKLMLAAAAPGGPQVEPPLRSAPLRSPPTAPLRSAPLPPHRSAPLPSAPLPYSPPTPLRLRTALSRGSAVRLHCNGIARVREGGLAVARSLRHLWYVARCIAYAGFSVAVDVVLCCRRPQTRTWKRCASCCSLASGGC